MKWTKYFCPTCGRAAAKIHDSTSKPNGKSTWLLGCAKDHTWEQCESDPVVRPAPAYQKTTRTYGYPSFKAKGKGGTGNRRL